MPSYDYYSQAPCPCGAGHVWCHTHHYDCNHCYGSDTWDFSVQIRCPACKLKWELEIANLTGITLITTETKKAVATAQQEVWRAEEVIVELRNTCRTRWISDHLVGVPAFQTKVEEHRYLKSIHAYAHTLNTYRKHRHDRSFQDIYADCIGWPKASEYADLLGRLGLTEQASAALATLTKVKSALTLAAASRVFRTIRSDQMVSVEPPPKEPTHA